MSAVMSAVLLLTAILGNEGIVLSLHLALMLFGTVFLFIQIYPKA
jgi:thiosulfate reductase cytochrome b subunit